MNTRLRTFVAGAVGMVVAFGMVELVHGLYQPVPSVLLAVAQRVIELTPGGFATRAIETLGGADIPILISSVVVFTLAGKGALGEFAPLSGYETLPPPLPVGIDVPGMPHLITPADEFYLVDTTLTPDQGRQLDTTGQGRGRQPDRANLQ